MTDIGIIFQPWGIRAILNGQKSQTRRLRGLKEINENPDDWIYVGLMGMGDRLKQPLHEFRHRTEHRSICMKCPYGRPGYVMWARETYAEWQGTSEFVKNEMMDVDEALDLVVYNDGKSLDDIRKDIKNGAPWNIRPSIHMPRWAARITRPITRIRCERVNQITEEDARAEGIIEYADSIGIDVRGYSFIELFEMVWDSINGPDSFQRGPYVWVVEWTNEGE